MSFIEDKIRVTCEKLREAAYKKLHDIENIEFVKADGYKKDNTPPKNGWKPFVKSQRVSGKDEHFWFRTHFTTPPSRENFSYYLKCTTGYEGQWDATNPQGLIYLNGKMTQGLDTNHTEVYLESDTDYAFHNYFYVGMIDSYVPYEMALCELDERTEHLLYDIKVAFNVCTLLHRNSNEYNKMMPIIEQTANLIDFRSVRSKTYYESIENAIEFINKELYDKLCSTENKPIVNCVGHTHIDVEWQWTRAQTREKIQRSFSTAATLMKKYPEFKFMLSQPELYRYLKEEAPEKYEELKDLVKNGQWEPEGAMWVESDCNLISGESFIRQILQGKKFFKDEFGIDSKVLFLPDVFGYSAAMPQILTKCGIRHFVTSKISWNETNTMPVDCFMWEGIDGTEIFTNFITAQDYHGPDPDRGTTYVGHLTASEIKGAWNKFLQKEYCSRALTTVGHGDGGGGPTKEMLEVYRRLCKGLPGMPVAKAEKLLNHLDDSRKEFDENCKKLKRIPKWVGELYLEFHRGTYTSIAKNKRSNRKSEFMLQLCESLSFIDMLFGGSYDAKGIYDKWNKVLHNQFHDIIPGSSIFEVYEGTDTDYKEIKNYCNDLILSKLDSISNKINTDGGILVYNPLGFARSGEITVDGKTVELDEKIPAFGWKVIQAPDDNCTVTINGLTAENKYYILTLDNSGAILSLFDKKAGREVFKKGQKGNEIQVFEDHPRAYDAWEITDYYKQKMWVLNENADITPIFDGERAGFKVVKNYMNSQIVQNIWLYSKNKRIDFENEIDWHETHQLVKAAFPFDIHTNSATYEIQFGHVSRPTHENTSWDKAKFEVYAHKWVDMSEKGYGVSLLNDCKYGYNAEGSTLKISMLKCATYPNHSADQGMHKFTYSLLPHIGEFTDSGVIQASYSLNQPLVCMPQVKTSGSLADCFSLINCDKENIIIETVKQAEEDDSLIVRLYDSFNCRTNATLTLADGFKKGYICDMLENELEKLEFCDNKVTVPVSNFEIVTLKFKK